MAAKTTTQVSWINGAAKDDNVLVNTPGTLASVHSFTIGNLLANDPGSATFYDAYDYATGLTWQAQSASTKTQVPPQHSTNTFTITTQYGGTVTVNKTTGAITYQPPATLTQAYITALGAGQAYTDNFFYVIWMGNQGAYSLAKATVSIAGVDDAATITGTSTGTTMEDVTLTATGNLSVVDPDNGESCFLAQAYTGTYGTLTVTPDSTGTNTVAGTGHWTYVLNNSAANVQALAAGETHTETFTVTSKGGTPITVTVTVVGTNDGPVVTNASSATAGSAQEDTVYSATGQLSASDVDNGDHQHWSVQGSDTGAYGTISVDGTGKWTYALNNAAAQSLAQGESHNETFTIRVADDSGAYADQTVTVSVTGTNDAPVITSDAQSGSTSEGDNGDPMSASGQVTYSDADLIDTHTFAVTAAAAHGSASVDANGNWSYSITDSGDIDALSEGDTMTDSFTVTVSDNNGATASQTVNITIVGTNDGPVITSADQSGTVSEGDNGDSQTASGQVTYSDVDANDTHTFAVTADAANGSASVDASGNWLYAVADAGAVDALAEGETMTDSFTVTVSDNHGGTASQTVDITITGTNDGPVITSGAQSGAVSEGDNGDDQTAAGQVTYSDADTNDTHTMGVTTAAAYGNASVDDNGNWSYTVLDQGAVDSLRAGETMTDSFVVTVSDNHGGAASQTVDITITGTNDQAVFSGGFTGDVTEDDPLHNTTGGTIAVSDADHDEDHIDHWIPSTLQGAYGLFSLDENTGVWGYTLDNSTVQSLNDGDTVQDVLRVFSVDGTYQDLTVTVHGTDDITIPTGGGGGGDDNPVTNYIVNHGKNDNNHFDIGNPDSHGNMAPPFDDNDRILYSHNLFYTGDVTSDANGTYVWFSYNSSTPKAHDFQVELVGFHAAAGFDWSAHVLPTGS